MITKTHLAKTDVNVADFLLDLRSRAEEYGLKALADKTGIPRTHLYVALSENGNPSASTLFKIMNALGMEFTAADKRKTV